MQLPGNSSAAVLPQTETKYVALTMPLNVLAVSAASLLPAHAANSQSSNSAPGTMFP